MVHVTGNFQSEAPISPKANEALTEAVSQGWADPRKLSQSSARARILLTECRESLAQGLGVLPQELEFLGEPNLAPYFALAGLLHSEKPLFYSAIDRKEVHALARSRAGSREMPVDMAGQIQCPTFEPGAVVAFQAANGETGLGQDLPTLIQITDGCALSWDFSTAAPYFSLPSQWDTATFDPKFWGGPQGFSIIAISEKADWKNPLPHLGALRTPQSYSLPLLMSAAVALEEWRNTAEHQLTELRALTQKFRSAIASRIENCDIAGGENLPTNALPHITSLSFLYVEGEELLRALEKRGFSVDSGSACTSEDLQPSHVLAAMGVLTHGNIRVTFHQGTTGDQVSLLIDAICEAVQELRKI